MKLADYRNNMPNIFWIAFLLICFGCSSAPSAQESLGLNLLVESDSVQLRRGTEPVMVSAGTEVRRGDILFSQSGQPIKILCSDLSLEVLEREGPCPCSEKIILDYKGYRVDTPMGVTQSIPYIVFPRHTKILDSSLVLRWKDTGASSYTVKIQDETGMTVWQSEDVSGNTIQLPAAIRLEKGKKYLLLVTDNDTGAYSGDDPVKGLGFSILDDNEKAEVLMYQRKIEKLDLQPDGKTFALAVYYATQGLSGEALQLLDILEPRQLTPAMWLWKANIYGENYLVNEAKQAYQQALDDALASGEKYIQAEANAGLWCVTNEQEYYRAAKKLFDDLKELQPEIVCEDRK
jgi:hypothetical protein